MEWLDNAVYWHWFILGVVLVILEAMSPGVFFLWLGIAAGAVGVILLFSPGLEWEYQLIWFAVLSVASISGWRYFLKHRPTKSDQPSLNRRGEQYIGRRFTLESNMLNGEGSVKVDDSTWRIKSPSEVSYRQGNVVEVIDVDGVILVVEEFTDN